MSPHRVLGTGAALQIHRQALEACLRARYLAAASSLLPVASIPSVMDDRWYFCVRRLCACALLSLGMISQSMAIGISPGPLAGVHSRFAPDDSRGSLLPQAATTTFSEKAPVLPATDSSETATLPNDAEAPAPDTPAPDTLHTITDLGILFDAANRARDDRAYQQALRLYGRILQVDSTQSSAYFQRARILADQERYRAAAMEFVTLEAVNTAPRANYIGTKGWYWLLAGEIDRARTASRRAMEIAPNYAAWPLNLGHSYLIDHQPETAKFFYRQAMEHIRGRSDLQRCLKDFDRLAQESYAVRLSVDPAPHVTRVRAMKDWFHVTYLREGDDLRSQTGWLAFLGTWVTLVGGLISLFGESGKSLTPESRDAVRSWLVDSDPTRRAQQWPTTFRALFESVFTSRHWSWACFGRSALASVSMVALTFLVMVAFGWTTTYQLARLGTTGSVALDVASTIVFVGAMNIVIDYLSLYQTRRVIGWMTETSAMWRHGALLALDAGLTFLLPLAVLTMMQAVATATSGQLAALSATALFVEIPGLILGFLNDAPIPQAMYISTFVTSIWLWLFVLGGGLLRLFGSVLSQVQWLSALVNIDEHPVKALGVVLAVVVTALFVVAAPVVL